MAEADVVEVTRAAQWRSWLRSNHGRPGGVWVVTYKKGAAGPVVGYEDLVCEALCWGWVDSKVGRVDDARTRTWFSPRRATSTWSASNRARVERLVAEGRMRPPGRAAVDAARASRRWGA